MRADYMMMYSYNRERSLFITHAYGLSTEVWCCPIKRDDGVLMLPRIHDLRHTFAVNRLTQWYREGKDVQMLLPKLSTYMGHTHLSHTSVYLTMTDSLLEEANKRFENYVNINENE